MNLPKRIKVGFHEYEVIFPYIFQEESGITGLHDGTLKKIHITDTYRNLPVPDSSIKQTLMHEIFHAIDFTSNLNVFYKEDNTADEDKLDGFAEWLCMVLGDNPDFTKLFLKGDR